MDKPRGFQVIGRAETLSILVPMPVGAIWGVGTMLKAKLLRSGIKTIGFKQIEFSNVHAVGQLIQLDVCQTTRGDCQSQ